MKGSNSLFDTLLEAGENKVTLFCDNLRTVFCLAKNEILDFIEKWDNGPLLSPRSVLFNKTLVNLTLLSTTVVNSLLFVTKPYCFRTFMLQDIQW